MRISDWISDVCSSDLMMAAAAFTQVESALRWFVDNFSIIADWRAALLRVASFRQAVIAHEDRPQFDSHIEYSTGHAGALVIDRLDVVYPAGPIPPETARRVAKARAHIPTNTAPAHQTTHDG